MLILFAILAFLSTIIGGYFAFKFKNRLHFVMAFAAGVLVALAFFEVFPEVITLATANHLELYKPMIAVLVGFLSFYILEKFMIVHACTEDGCDNQHHESVGLLGGIGITLHSLIDGLAMGAGFLINPQVGVLVSVGVILHKFSDGLCTVTLMLTNKNDRAKITGLLLAVALAPVVGIFIPGVIKITETSLTYILAYFVGFFLYIGASDLLPEAHERGNSIYLMFFTIIGVALVFVASRLI
ncbi:MAG: ZIP family metal transporter [Candidatus Berkelbacteria bacterium]